MDFYSLFLFGHIAFAIVWLGSGVMLQVVASRFDRTDDAVALEKLFGITENLGHTLFMPSSLLVIATGVVLTIDGPWSFGSLWVVLALIGFVTTFLIGMLWIAPQSGRIHEVMQSDGGMSPRAQALARRMMVVSRIDTTVLFLVVFDMVMKPSGDDTGTLLVMAAVLLASIVIFGSRARTMAVTPSTSENKIAEA